MSRPSSRIHARGFHIQLCSVLLILAFLGAIAVPILGALMFFVDDSFKAPFVGTLVGTILTFGIFYVMAWAVRCKVCTNQLFAPRKCIRHSSVQQAFGSYSLWMAITSVTAGFFRCQFCGEKTRVRERLRGKYKQPEVTQKKEYRHAVKLKDDQW